MRPKMILCHCMLVFTILLSGCWSRRELNTLGIVVGIGIDKPDNGYEISVQMVNPAEISNKDGQSSGRTPVTVFSSKGDTIAEAIRKLSALSPRESYFSHLRIIVISEKLAAEGISNILDYVSRDHEFRTDYYFVVAKGASAKQMMTFMTPLEKIPSTKIFNSLETAEREWSAVTTFQLDELVNSIASEGRSPVLTGIRVVGDTGKSGSIENLKSTVPAASLQTSGVAVFKRDKMVGWLNETESKGYSNIANKLDRTVLNVACPEEGRLALDVIRSDTRVKGRLVNGKPHMEVKMRIEANVSDVECRIDLTKNESIMYLEKQAEKEIKEHSEASLKKAKKLKSDIFGFGEAIHRAEPAYWHKVKNDWDSHFTNLSADINVDVRIRRLGTLGDPLINKLKE